MGFVSGPLDLDDGSRWGPDAKLTLPDGSTVSLSELRDELGPDLTISS